MVHAGFVMLRRSFCILFIAALLAAPAHARSAEEQAKIDWLIDSIAALHDARFIRNGMEYDAAAAADHLRLKLRLAGNRVATAADFISCCATGSSMSGLRYRIRLADGQVVDAADFLRSRLAAHEARAPDPG